MRWWLLILVGCGGNAGQSLTSETVFGSATVAIGSGAQLRVRTTLSEMAGQLIEHDGLNLELHVRAIDDNGQSTAGLFTIDMDATSPAATLSESIAPGNQSFDLLVIEEGECEPGCFAEIDFAFAHTEGGAASLTLEMRSEATVHDGDANVLITLESVF